MNRGKDFEQNFSKQLKEFFDINRIPDGTMGYMGGRNICDFIAYRYPNLFYLELKTTKGNTLPFSNITDTQYIGLLDKESYEGVGCGLIVWFVERDKTFFIGPKCYDFIKGTGAKSINIKTLEEYSRRFNIADYFSCFEIKGEKKRVFFNYNIKKFTEDLEIYLNYGKRD